MGSTCSPRDYSNYNSNSRSIYIYINIYNSIFNSNSLGVCNFSSHSALRSEAQAQRTPAASQCVFVCFLDMWLGLLLCNHAPLPFPSLPAEQVAH